MVPHHPTAIEWGDPVVPPPPPGTMPPRLAGIVRSTFVYVPPWAESMRWCPWVLQAMLDGIHTRSGHFDANFITLLRLVVSQETSCRYCYGTSRMFLRLLGYSEDFIRTLEHDLLAADLDPPRRAALDYARLLARANPQPGDSHREALRALGYTNAAVAEIGAFTTAWVMERPLHSAATLAWAQRST
jgi:alkylhydroperoxidase family enzyme